MADLAHIKMESANGSSNGSNGSATDLKELIAKSNDKTRSMIEQGGDSTDKFILFKKKPRH